MTMLLRGSGAMVSLAGVAALFLPLSATVQESTTLATVLREHTYNLPNLLRI